MSYKKFSTTLSFLFFTLLLVVAPFINMAQATQEGIEMADVMRSNGKFYMVVGVLGIIFVGIIITLLVLERRIKRLEQKA